jgi:protein TonB
METTDNQNFMHKGMLLSFAIHTLCIASIMFFVTLATQHPEAIRVLLTLDPPGGGGGGGGSPKMTAEEKKPQPFSGRHIGRRASRPVRGPHLTPAADKAPVEPAVDVLPVMDKAPVEETTPLNAISYGLREDAAAPAVAVAGEASAGGEGGGFGGGKGTGSGTGVRSGSGTGSGSGIGTGIGSGVGSYVGPGQGR